MFKSRGWDKSPSLLIVFGLSSKTQWLSGLYYTDFISFYSPTQLCGGGTTKSNSNELPISVPLSICFRESKQDLHDSTKKRRFSTVGIDYSSVKTLKTRPKIDISFNQKKEPAGSFILCFCHKSTENTIDKA